MTEIETAAKPAPTPPAEGGPATPETPKAPATGVVAGKKPEAKPEEKQPKKSLVAQRAAAAAPPEPKGEQPEAADEGGDPDGEQEKAAAADGPPAKYEWKAPEGQTFDAPTLNAFEQAVRDAGLNNEKAQKILDKVAPVMAQRQAEAIEAQQEEWAEQIRKDPTLGGDNLEASLELAERGRSVFPPATQKLLDGPMGDHPAMFAGLVELGKRVSPDSQVGPGAGAREKAAPVTEDDVLRAQYPNDVV